MDFTGSDVIAAMLARAIKAILSKSRMGKLTDELHVVVVMLI